MAIQYFPHPLAGGIESIGSSLGSALQQRGERSYEQKQKERERTRQSQYGGTLERVVGGKPIENMQELTSIRARLLKQRIPSAEVDKMLAPHAAVILGQAKETAKAATEKAKLETQYKHIDKIFGPLGGGGDQQLQSLDGQQPIGEEVNEVAQGMPRTVTSSQGREFSQNDMSRMIMDPDVGVRESGKSLQDQLNRKQTAYLGEQQEIRKEHRGRISKHADPFTDMIKLRKNVDRLNEVERIVKTEKASYDQSTWRTVASALLDDANHPYVADLIKTEPQKKLFALLRPFFGTKEIGGSNPSTREVLITLSTLPSATKKKVTNEYITKLLKNEAETMLEQGKVINEIQDEDQTFSEYQQRLEERIAPFQAKKQEELVRLSEVQAAKAITKYKKPKRNYTFVLSPTGDVKEIKNENLSRAIKAGGINLSEY